MPRRVRLSALQLKERWSQESDVARFADLMDLRDFLASCIIRGNYSISDSLNSAIVLSSYGDWLLRELAKKKVPTKEARLMCFLEFYHLDVLIDPARMDPAVVADAISDELVKGRILLPFIHGPDLYNRACELFPDERQRLGAADTLRLLDGMPVGVFHHGRWVSGPYGILESRARRSVGPTRSIPLQHCHDIACRRVHKVQLETDYSARINEQRPIARKTLEAEGVEASDFSIFLAEAFRDDSHRFDDFRAGTLPLFLGECLSGDEVQHLLADLVEKDPSLRSVLGEHGLHGELEEFVKALSRAQAIQLALIAADSAITTSLDDLVAREVIAVPPDEVRSPVLFPNTASGAFGAQVELSRNGVRVTGGPDLALLRLRRLVDRIYSSDSVEDAEELSWQLRTIPALNLDAQLDEFLRTATPRTVVERLVLNRKAHTELAAAELGIDIAGTQDLSPSKLADRVLWKIGFNDSRPERLHERFWELHDELAQSARSASVSTTVNEEAMRGLSANYFRQLEMILADSLAFAAWVLTHDHISAERPFHYDDDACRSQGLATLASSPHNVDGPSKTPLDFGNKTTLHALTRGFAILADHLEAAQESGDDHKRGSEQTPRYVGHTSLMRFPLLHTMPFLDLLPSSKKRILTSLREVSASLVRAKVADVRNGQIHYRRAASDLKPLIDGLEAVRGAVRTLEDLGLVRILYVPSRIETDQWYRTTVYMDGGQGRQVALGLPSPYSWLNLPSVDQPQYLVVAAQFRNPMKSSG